MPQKIPEMQRFQIARVLGAVLLEEAPEQVQIQCSLRTGERCELQIPLAAAMYLLTILREIEKDSQGQLPR